MLCAFNLKIKQLSCKKGGYQHPKEPVYKRCEIWYAHRSRGNSWDIAKLLVMPGAICTINSIAREVLHTSMGNMVI